MKSGVNIIRAAAAVSILSETLGKDTANDFITNTLEHFNDISDFRFDTAVLDRLKQHDPERDWEKELNQLDTWRTLFR